MAEDTNPGLQGSGFVIENGPNGRTLVVTGDWSDEHVALVSGGVVDGLTLNYARGYRERSLDFLREWPVRQLYVLARTIKDIEPVYRLSDTLEDLSLTTAPTAVLDCARLPRLTSVSVENWGQLRESLSAAPRLRTVGVYGFGERDLLALTDNADLTKIWLTQAPRLESLLGVEMLPRLSSVDVIGARNLTDLSSLTGLGPRLRHLGLRSCKNLGSIDALSTLTGLQSLWLANCGHIASLNPMRDMTELVDFIAWESTRIDDGDLSPLLQLPRLTGLRMMERRMYSPSVTEVKQRLGITD